MRRRLSVYLQKVINKLNEVDKFKLNELFNKVYHITKWIESCTIIEQLNTCENIVENLYVKYPKNQYIYQYLKYLIRKRKLIIDKNGKEN